MLFFTRFNWLILLLLITFSLNAQAVADSSVLSSVVCYNGWSQSGSTTSVDLGGKNADGQNIPPVTPTSSGGSSGHYLEDNELVIFEKQGPGVISRIWATNVIALNANYLDGSPVIGVDGVRGLQGANEMGVFKIFVDESTIPISVNSWDLFCSPSSSQITENFVWPKRSSCNTPFDAEFTGDASNGAAGGWFNYFPIYFNSKIKIRVTGKDLTRYYSIDYQLLSPNQASSSFSLASREPTLKQAFVASPSFSYSNEKSLTGALSIPAGSINNPTTGILANLPNAGTITRIELSFSNPSISQINYDSFNLISLTGFWDGSSTPAFITPIPHFFNYFNSSFNSQGLFSGFTGTTFYSNYPMPFKTGGKIQINNYGSQNITINYVVKYVETENAFNCQSVGRFKVEEKAFYPTNTGQDLILLEKNNQKGKVVGLTLYAETISSSQAESPAWGILEGDERVQIDSVQHAAVHGTGTEDFFNGGWYFVNNDASNCTRNSRSFSRPFAGNVISKDFSESTCRFRTLLYRQLLLDAYRYNDSIKFSIEHGGDNEINGNYRTSVFYYDQGSSALVANDQINVGDNSSRSAHSWTNSNPAPENITINSIFLSAGYPSFSGSGYQINGSQFSEFNLAINPTNKGVVLKRVYDWLRGKQSADVYVDNVRVSKWIDPSYIEIPSANSLKKVAESTFFIPESFTNGKSNIRVKLQTSSNEKFTLFTISGRTVNYTISTPSTESCQNGVDDDGDSLIDCQDSQCSASTVGLTCSLGVLPTCDTSGTKQWICNYSTVSINNNGNLDYDLQTNLVGLVNPNNLPVTAQTTWNSTAKTMSLQFSTSQNPHGSSQVSGHVAEGFWPHRFAGKEPIRIGNKNLQVEFDAIVRKADVYSKGSLVPNTGRINATNGGNQAWLRFAWATNLIRPDTTDSYGFGYEADVWNSHDFHEPDEPIDYFVYNFDNQGNGNLVERNIENQNPPIGEWRHYKFNLNDYLDDLPFGSVNYENFDLEAFWMVLEFHNGGANDPNSWIDGLVEFDNVYLLDLENPYASSSFSSCSISLVDAQTNQETTNLRIGKDYRLKVETTNVGNSVWNPLWNGTGSGAGQFKIGLGRGFSNGVEEGQLFRFFFNGFRDVNRLSYSTTGPITNGIVSVSETRTITPTKTGSTTLQFRTVQEWVDGSNSTNALGWFGAMCEKSVTISSPAIENCTNRLDDDGDSLIDCQDSDCPASGTPSCSSTTCQNKTCSTTTFQWTCTNLPNSTVCNTGNCPANSCSGNSLISYNPLTINALCSNGSCPNLPTCNGQQVTTACGTGASCSDSSAPASCKTCAANQANCDLNPTTGTEGCEVNLLTNNAHCGQCGRAVGLFESCINGTPTGIGSEVCNDEIDNEWLGIGDGKIDCADEECFGFIGTDRSGKEFICPGRDLQNPANPALASTLVCQNNSSSFSATNLTVGKGGVVDVSKTSSVSTSTSAFDAVCGIPTGSTQLSFFECDADGIREGRGSSNLTKPLGTIITGPLGQYICAMETVGSESYESWVACGTKLGPHGSQRTAGGTVTINGESYTCQESGVWRTPSSPSCQPLYSNHNDATDPSRFNIVISPVGFSTNAVAIERAKILIDLDNTSQSFYGYSGFSRVFPISNHKDKFNFWVIPNQTFESFANNPGWCVDKQLFEDSCGFLESSGVKNYNFILYERKNGRNYPDEGLTPQAMCQFGSWGRNGAVLDLPENFNTTFYNDNSFNNRKTILAADVHEMSHSIFLLLDEYVNRPANLSPQTDPDFDNFSTAVKGSTDLTFNDLKQFYFHRPEEPTATRNDCVENALWKNYLGDGCGVPGVIDCVQNISQLEDDPLPLPACVGGGTDCWYEIVCARGIRWDTGSYRPVINSLMNGHSGHDQIRFGYWNELLVNHVLQKGATPITLNYNMFSDFVPPVENCSDGIDNDLDRLIDCGDNQCSTNSACIAPVESCSVNADPTTLTGSGSSSITVTPINFASDPSSILVTCSDSTPAQNVPITTEGNYITSCSYIASTETQTKTVQATVGSKTCQTTVTINPPITPVVEICTNGLDDDSDLAIDCADSDCDSESICAASTSVGACPLPNGNNSISRSNSTGIDTVSVVVGSTLVNPSVSLFTSLNELIPCSPTGSTRTCVIGTDFTRERSFKVSVTCSQTDGTRGRTDYFVTLNPANPASSIPVPEIPFEFVFIIMITVVILFSIKKK